MQFDNLETVMNEAEVYWLEHKNKYKEDDRLKSTYLLGWLKSSYERMYNDLPESKKRINEPEKINSHEQ